MRLLYVPSALFVRGNAAATAANIAAHEPLFRLGILCSLIGGVVWLFVPLSLYRLLKDIDHGLAVIMVIVGGVMQTPLYVINTMTDAAALLFVRGADFLSAFSAPQREALALLFLRLHHHLDVAAAIFSGLWLIPLGLLVYRSRFLPRLIGIWLIAGCFAWLAFCVAGLMFPGSEDKVFSMAQPIVFGEVVFMLWLVIMGARERPVTVA